MHLTPGIGFPEILQHKFYIEEGVITHCQHIDEHADNILQLRVYPAWNVASHNDVFLSGIFIQQDVESGQITL